MIDFEHEYIVIFVKCETTSLRFFVEMLGFNVYEHIEIAGRICPILQMQSGHYMILIEKEVTECETITLMTDDCLRDYHTFRKQGMEQLGKPEYTDAGLRISFYDPSGNKITMLEARDYTDA
jgi:hypothetical protein